MLNDPKFGPSAQTPEQRATVLAHLELATPGLVTKANSYARQLYVRYIAGELSWTEVRELRDAAVQLNHKST